MTRMYEACYIGGRKSGVGPLPRAEAMTGKPARTLICGAAR